MDAAKAARTRNVGYVFDAVMELHINDRHPEHPERVRELNRHLQESGLLARCIKLKPRLATNNELLACHSQEHIDQVDHLHEKAADILDVQGAPLERVGDTFIITGDIFCNSNTSLAARSAVGCAIQAVEAVLSGQVHSAFAVVRPPGHHAEPSEPMGFCFFNNAAVAARAALTHPGIHRVLIFDWDIHHGNGTQRIFEADDQVLVVSLHRRDKNFFPVGVGYETEVGVDRGKGFNVNVPWSGKGVGDADYMAALDLVLEPIIAEFDPQLVIISAGFDAAEGDILGKCHVTTEGFSQMTAALMRYAGGKVVAVLEGGYVPRLVGECAAAVFSRLLGDPTSNLAASALSKLHRSTGSVLAKVDAVQRQHWSKLAAQPPFATAYKAYKAALELESLSLASSSSSRARTCGVATRSRSHAAAAAGGAVADASSPQNSANYVVGCTTEPQAPLAAQAPPLRGRIRIKTSAKGRPSSEQTGLMAAGAAGGGGTAAAVDGADAADASGPRGIASDVAGCADSSQDPLAQRVPPLAGRLRIKLSTKQRTSRPQADLTAGAAAVEAAASPATIESALFRTGAAEAAASAALAPASAVVLAKPTPAAAAAAQEPAATTATQEPAPSAPLTASALLMDSVKATSAAHELQNGVTAAALIPAVPHAGPAPTIAASANPPVAAPTTAATTGPAAPNAELASTAAGTDRQSVVLDAGLFVAAAAALAAAQGKDVAAPAGTEAVVAASTEISTAGAADAALVAAHGSPAALA